MKWPMDVHKYMSEITRTALKIISDAGITNDSSDDEIKIVEQRLAANKVYKSFESATGRIRRALLTYFKAYNCMDQNCNITPVGRAFVDNVLSVQEFSFHYIVNYRNPDPNNAYYPTEFILTCLKKLEQTAPSEAYITPDDFRRITECNSIADIDDSFIEMTINNRSIPYNVVDERQIGFDVWKKMLCQAGILQDDQKDDIKILCIKNSRIVDWLLEVYQKSLTHNPYEITSGVLRYIPQIECSLGASADQCSSESLAFQAFLFDGIDKDIIDRYIIRHQDHNLNSLLNCFDIKDSHSGYYNSFAGLEHLVGYRLMMSSDEALQNLGRIFLDIPINKNDQNDDSHDRNVIFFGAPGTGKSHTLNKEALLFSNEIERVTFYPNYSYSQFVGCYKPTMVLDQETQKEEITYRYVPGPFMRQWIKAQNTSDPVLLIIEELNRANAPAVFGDMFQLLDRKNGESEYPVATSEDLRKYLSSLLPGGNTNVQRDVWEKLPEGTDVTALKIPANLYIWATMNSADQGVFPLDTAFKRRWDYRYFSATDNDAPIDKLQVRLANGTFSWGAIRTAINLRLAKNSINEDKFIGPYFINESVFADEDSFMAAFENKVIMYLFEDAARQYRTDIFKASGNSKPIYSQIIRDFREKGTDIFAFPITGISTNNEDATISTQREDKND